MNCEIELKFNPNHDPSNGQFTFGSGGRSPTAPLRARLASRSLIALEDCEDGWCEVRARRLQGFVRQAEVFGTQDRPLCNAARPAGRGR